MTPLLYGHFKDLIYHKESNTMPGSPPVNMNPPGRRYTPEELANNQRESYSAWLAARSIKGPEHGGVAAPTRKLHPRHTPENIAQYVLNMGEYPDPTRNTGRTLIIALTLIAEALKNPSRTVHIKDHHPSSAADIHLSDLIRDIIKALGLEHLHVSRPALTLIFERRATPKAPSFPPIIDEPFVTARKHGY